MNPIAVVPCYNEADIIGWTIRHLREQACDVHVIDNHSTDGSLTIAKLSGANSWELWPASGPLEHWDWLGMLRRVEEFALNAGKSAGRWCIFHDADEIRRSPRPQETIAAGLKRVEQAGANAIDFRVLTFVPVDNGYLGDPESYFRHYDAGRIDAHLPQVKAWIQGPDRVTLAEHGGHQAEFAGRRIAPEKWILKHYPIRSQAHGERKVFRERRARYTREELARSWHVQYDGYQSGASFLGDPEKLSRAW